MSGVFNAELLRIARQARGMSQTALARHSGVSQANVSKLENDLSEATDEVIGLLASVLDFPMSFFFQPDRIYGLPVSVHPMYRKRASVGQRSLGRLEAWINIRLMHIRRLMHAVDYEPELPLPRNIGLDTISGNPEEIADLVRRTWLVPSGPLKNLVEWVERAGCVVMHCDFSNIPVDAVTVPSDNMPPCIFLNKNQPPDRQRFNLAHELGHIIMHPVPSPMMEDEANAFASALLMPTQQIRPYLHGRLTIQKLASLKPVWLVSMQALLYRAKVIGAITENQSRYIWRQLSALGYRKNEPPDPNFPIEEPKVLAEMIRVHTEYLDYSIEDLCSLLHMSEDELISIHPIPIGLRNRRPKLRVLKR